MKAILTIALLVSLTVAQKGKMRHGNERIVVQNKGNEGMFKTTMGPGATQGGETAGLKKEDQNMEFKTYSGNETESMF